MSACLVINPITVDDFDALFNRMPVDRASDNDGTEPKLFILVGWEVGTGALWSVVWSIVAHLMVIFVSGFQWCCLKKPRISICHTTRCIC